MKLTGDAVRLSGRGSVNLDTSGLEYEMTLGLAQKLFTKITRPELRAGFKHGEGRLRADRLPPLRHDARAEDRPPGARGQGRGHGRRQGANQQAARKTKISEDPLSPLQKPTQPSGSK